MVKYPFIPESVVLSLECLTGVPPLWDATNSHCLCRAAAWSNESIQIILDVILGDYLKWTVFKSAILQGLTVKPFYLSMMSVVEKKDLLFWKKQRCSSLAVSDVQYFDSFLFSGWERGILAPKLTVSDRYCFAVTVEECASAKDLKNFSTEKWLNVTYQCLGQTSWCNKRVVTGAVSWTWRLGYSFLLLGRK